MEAPIKQTAGIDCGMQELVVSFGLLTINGNFICRLTKAFTNTAKGFSNYYNGLLKYLLKKQQYCL